MNVLLIFEKGFPVNTDKLTKFLKQKLPHIELDLNSQEFEIKDSIISKPKTFKTTLESLNNLIDRFDKIFYFTKKQYEDNFFIHEYGKLTIFSIYGWHYLTNIPISNGIVYFIINYFALEIDKSEHRHYETTGCIYDFLTDKRGIDNGMRQASLCPNCLKRVSESITNNIDEQIFNDLKILMDNLSQASRWNQDILDGFMITEKRIVSTRNPKNNEGLKIVIASPSDTLQERETLLNQLERNFRTNNHEKHCGMRIMVNGWEDIASQPGYTQDIINKKIIEESDFVIAVFKHKIGTATIDGLGNKRSESGTVEELLQALNVNDKTHPLGMAYFFSEAPVISLESPEKQKIEEDWEKLKEFKKTIKDKMLYKPYLDPNDLLRNVLQDLEKNIIDYIIK